jgi:hypothetical protein
MTKTERIEYEAGYDDAVHNRRARYISPNSPSYKRGWLDGEFDRKRIAYDMAVPGEHCSYCYGYRGHPGKCVKDIRTAVKIL